MGAFDSGVAWVAGSGGGIGAACVAALTDSGFTVHGSERPNEDLTLPGVAESVGAELERGPGISVAVHAIGMSGRSLGDGPVGECRDEAWDEVLRVDLTSAFWFVRSCLRHMSRGGAVVLVGSALARSLDRDFLTVAYRVAKAGLIPLAEAAAFEGAGRGVRVNVVSPGLVDTPMAARALADTAIRERLGELMPLGGRASSPSDVAEAVRWLVSDAAGQTTGAVLPVDGGWGLR